MNKAELTRYHEAFTAVWRFFLQYAADERPAAAALFAELADKGERIRQQYDDLPMIRRMIVTVINEVERLKLEKERGDEE